MQITAFSFLLQVLSEAICQQWQGKQKGQKLQERNSLKLPWAEIANKENVEKKRKIDLEIATKLILHGILFIRAITWQLQDKISPKIWFDFGQRCSSFKWIWMLWEGLSTLPFTFLTILHSVVSTHSLYVATYFMKGFEFWHLWLLPMGEKHFGN